MMSCSNPTHANAPLLFLLIFLAASSFKPCCCIRNYTIFCPETEKQSLLTLKQSLEDSSDDLLSSWDAAVDCCDWDGVVCDNLSGHVTELHLAGDLSGKINPSLVNLKFLKYLNLTENYYGELSIPSFIGSFTHLEYLNLDGEGFVGRIPSTIANLSNLHTLLLHSDALSADSLEWMWGLTKLEYLKMKDVDLQEVHNLPKVINSLPSLIELTLTECNLDRFMASSDDVNVTSLTLLDLSSNYIESVPFLRWILQLNELLYLDLNENRFEGAIPSFKNATKLRHTDLSSNYFNSSIPDFLYFHRDLEFVDLGDNLLQGTLSSAIANLTSLFKLDLSSNKLSGKIPKEISYLCKMEELHLGYNHELRGELADSFGNMSECFLGSLRSLRLSSNQLYGELSDEFGEFKRLMYLDLGSNKLSGSIPVSLGRLSSLKALWLDDNNFTAVNPLESLGELFNLEVLGISDNKLEGVVSEANFKNLQYLRKFYASGNHLSLKVSQDWIPPFQLERLELGSWDLGAGYQIPSWLDTQKNSISALDLSNTGISGSVPSWFWEIERLNLSHNHLHGQIPSINGSESGGYQTFFLSSNQFSGSLPLIRGSMIMLDLSNNSFSGGLSHFFCGRTQETYNLMFLNLDKNQLGGELPTDAGCWMKWSFLRYLNIADNNLAGSIPDSIGYLTQMWSLNLYGNKFSGPLPFSLSNCTNLRKMDLAHNDLDGSMPPWIGESLFELVFLILRSNKFDGLIPREICRLNQLQILDLSDNAFSGIIPGCVHNFSAMKTKRDIYDFISIPSEGLGESASVATKGIELQYDRNLMLVTNIDLSKNNLSGEIPEEFTSLVELRSLNLSQNHFTGSIPDQIGNLRQLESLDFSNNSLTGQIPSSIADISALSYLNVSFNKLTGRIPHGTQLQSMDASAYVGNNLCGPPLTSNCSSNSSGNQVPRVKQDDEGNKIEWLYAFMSLGYAVGFSAVCTTLVLKKSWRVAYFKLLEGMWDKLYVYVCVKWTRLVKPSISTS